MGGGTTLLPRSHPPPPHHPPQKKKKKNHNNNRTPTRLQERRTQKTRRRKMILDTKRFLPLICFLCLTSWAKLNVPKNFPKNFRWNYTIDPSSFPNKHYWSLKFKKWAQLVILLTAVSLSAYLANRWIMWQILADVASNLILKN